MSSAAIIAIAIAVAVVLAAIVFVTTARRSDVRGAGALSTETRRRDEIGTSGARQRGGDSHGERRGRDDQSGHGRRRAHRRGGRTGRRRGPPPDAGARASRCSRAVGAARPRGDRGEPAPVLQPVHGDPDGHEHRSVLRRRIRRLPLADGHGRVRPSRRRRQDRRHQGSRLGPTPASSTPRRPARGSPSIRPKGCPTPRRSTTRRSSLGCATTASSPCTRSARTSVVAFPSATSSRWFECPCHGSQYNQVGEKKGGPAPRGMDRFSDQCRRRRQRRRRHRHGVRRSGDRHEHHRSGSRRSPLHHGGWRTLGGLSPSLVRSLRSLSPFGRAR